MSRAFPIIRLFSKPLIVQIAGGPPMTTGDRREKKFPFLECYGSLFERTYGGFVLNAIYVSDIFPSCIAS